MRERRRNKQEKVLSVFDQSGASDNHHFLNVSEDDYPKEYHQVVRRLLKAAAEPKVRQTINLEDEILEELGDLERVIEEKDKAIEEKEKRLELALRLLIDSGVQEKPSRKSLGL